MNGVAGAANAGRARTALTLVAGGRAGEREAAIAAALVPGMAVAVILEGLPDGNATLAGELPGAPHIVRIAPGCLCCAGNMILRVSLNRLLRRRPARLFISLADSAHLEQLRSWLSRAPYDDLLRLETDFQLGRGT
jgi:hypothetical protein